MYVGHEIETAPMDMSKFDGTNAPKVANEYLKTVKEPRRRQILINFRDHALAECLGDHEALMATCSQKRQEYATWSNPEMQDGQPQDYESLWHYYKFLIDQKMYVIHTDIEKIIVGDDELVIDVVFHQIFPGAMLRDFLGLDFVDPEITYEAINRGNVTFLFDEDGKGCGEQTYTATGTMTEKNLRPLKDSEIPAQFTAGPTTVKEWLAAHPDLDWPSE